MGGPSLRRVPLGPAFPCEKGYVAAHKRVLHHMHVHMYVPQHAHVHVHAIM